jgi:hypothetical protein
MANHTTSFFFVTGFGSGAYSAKLLAGTKQRLSGLSQACQCGDDALRMSVTGGPPVLGDLVAKVQRQHLNPPNLRVGSMRSKTVARAVEQPLSF